MRCATEVVEHKGLPGELATEAIVDELYLPFFVDEYVLELQVAMDDLQAMQILQHPNYLLGNGSCRHLAHLTPLAL